MRKFLISIGVFLLSVCMAHGQGVPVNGEVLKSTSGQAASVRVCTKDAVSNPCTILASIFKDEALTVPEVNPLPTDAYGNYVYYVAPGVYKEQITANRATRTRMVNVASVDGADIKPKSVAVGTTVQLDGSSPISVKAKGAKCDNSTDDTAAIQAAIDAARTAGGGEVQLPRGVCRFSQLVMKSYVRLTGQGWPNTVLKQLNGANAHAIIVLDATVEQTGIFDLAIDGNKAAQTGTWDGIHYDQATSTSDRHHEFGRVYVHDFTGEGVYLSGRGENKLFAIFSKSNGGHGFYIGSPDTWITDSDAATNGLSGFVIASANVHLNHTKAWWNGTLNTMNDANGYLITAAGRTILTGAEAQDNYEHGFRFVTSYGCVGSGLLAESNGRGGVRGSGFQLANTFSCTIVGNADDRQENADGTPSGVSTQKYAVQFLDGATANQIYVSARRTAMAAVIDGDTTGNTVQVIHSTNPMNWIAGPLTNAQLVTPSIGGIMTSYPAHFPVYMGTINTLTGTTSGNVPWTPPYAVTCTRIEVNLATQKAVTCGTPGVFTVMDNGGATAFTSTIPDNSWAWKTDGTLNVAAGHTLTVKQTTAAGTCSTTPQGAYITLTCRMQ